MFRLDEKIKNQAITIVHSAPVLPVEPNQTFVARYKAIRHHVAQHRKASHLCITQDPDGTQTFRLAPCRGVSLAASIETWLLAAQIDVADEMAIIIPMHRRIYIATVQNGLIIDEKALVDARLDEALKEITDATTVRVFNTGSTTQKLVEHLAELEAVPFDLRHHQFKPIWWIYLLQGFPHKFHFIMIFLVGLMALSTQFFAPARVAVIATADLINVTPKSPTVTSDASPNIRDIATFLQTEMLPVLAAEGLKTFSLQANHYLVKGGANNYYPAKVQALADQMSIGFAYGVDGWTLQLPVVTTTTSMPLADFPATQLDAKMFAAARYARVQLKLTSRNTNKDSQQSAYSIVANRRGTIHIQLQRLAKALAQQPVVLTRATCQFNAVWKNCALSLTATGLLL